METITAYDFKAKAQEAFKHCKDHYLDDLNAMSEEALTNSPGGCARTPAEFTATCEDIETALNNIPPDEMLRTIHLPNDTTTPYDLVRFTAYHTGYHDAQLNYIQALANDGEMHWKFD